MKKIISAIFKRKISRVIVICLIIVLASYFLIHNNIFGLRSNVFNRLFGVRTVSAQTLRTARVTKGELDVTVTGSGPIASANRVDVFPGVNTTITKVYFKEGDKVKEGDLMYELDDTDARSNIEKIKNDIARMQITPEFQRI